MYEAVLNTYPVRWESEVNNLTSHVGGSIKHLTCQVVVKTEQFDLSGIWQY